MIVLWIGQKGLTIVTKIVTIYYALRVGMHVCHGVCIVSISAISDIHRRVTITAYRTIDSEHVYGRDFQDHCRESHGDFHVECVWLC